MRNTFHRALALLVATASITAAQVDGSLINPIVPGDHPDPTIIRVGDIYWTASTAGNCENRSRSPCGDDDPRGRDAL
jgi:hypothetical protein